MKISFDNQKYIELQSKHIRDRIAQFGGKLYLEFGGKLFDDYHASRVLPGFKPDSKLQMLLQLKEKAEVVIVVNTDDIEKNKIRGDLGITYDLDVLRLIDAFRNVGLYVGSVVLTRFESVHPAVAKFERKLTEEGIKIYHHYTIKGYPSNVEKIVSDEGFGKNEYIETERELVIVTGPGPGSGKMAVCLSQLYNDNKRGVKAGYAKFETFPIWNKPLRHPVNLAYEAATADLNDVNMIDPYHLEKYGETAVNYNRDVEIFPVLDAIFKGIYGDQSPYFSPTDMGVNMVGNCIIDDENVIDASKREIVRRYFDAHCACRDDDNERNRNAVQKIELLMQQAGITKNYRKVVEAAKNKSAECGAPAAAIELHDGRIITGKATELLENVSAMLLNALKEITSIPDEIHLLAPEVIGPVRELKCQYLSRTYKKLNVNEILIALSISAHTSATAAYVLKHLPSLAGCDIHSTVMLPSADVEVLKKLGLNVTCEPKYQIKEIFIG
jgi:uncharacterized protein (UPF0371 family)